MDRRGCPSNVVLRLFTYTAVADDRDGARRYPGPDAMYDYDLFAVINHGGQMDNGHYTNFARFRDEVGRFFREAFSSW